jgi:uncharacterized protein Smg (DUF494 family)
VQSLLLLSPVVLMVLFSQPGEEEAYARMEVLVFDQRPDAVH